MTIFEYFLSFLTAGLFSVFDGENSPSFSKLEKQELHHLTREITFAGGPVKFNPKHTTSSLTAFAEKEFHFSQSKQNAIQNPSAFKIAPIDGEMRFEERLWKAAYEKTDFKKIESKSSMNPQQHEKLPRLSKEPTSEGSTHPILAEHKTPNVDNKKNVSLEIQRNPKFSKEFKRSRDLPKPSQTEESPTLSQKRLTRHSEQLARFAPLHPLEQLKIPKKKTSSAPLPFLDEELAIIEEISLFKKVSKTEDIDQSSSLNYEKSFDSSSSSDIPPPPPFPGLSEDIPVPPPFPSMEGESKITHKRKKEPSQQRATDGNQVQLMAELSNRLKRMRPSNEADKQAAKVTSAREEQDNEWSEKESLRFEASRGAVKDAPKKPLWYNKRYISSDHPDYEKALDSHLKVLLPQKKNMKTHHQKKESSEKALLIRNQLSAQAKKWDGRPMSEILREMSKLSLRKAKQNANPSEGQNAPVDPQEESLEAKLIAELGKALAGGQFLKKTKFPRKSPSPRKPKSPIHVHDSLISKTLPPRTLFLVERGQETSSQIDAGIITTAVLLNNLPFKDKGALSSIEPLTERNQNISTNPQNALQKETKIEKKKENVDKENINPYRNINPAKMIKPVGKMQPASEDIFQIIKSKGR